MIDTQRDAECGLVVWAGVWDFDGPKQVVEALGEPGGYPRHHVTRERTQYL